MSRAPLALEELEDAEAVARRGATFVASEARAAIAARGRFHCAFSGGRAPWRMLSLFAEEDLAWPAVHVFQVDERCAPRGSAERNLTRLEECLARLPAVVHAMPVDAAAAGSAEAGDSGAAGEAAARAYARELRAAAGEPPVLDLVHLGLGTDGHTASLFPGDPALAEDERDVVVTSEHAGWPRMTLTLPVLSRARRVLWLVTGAEKAEVLAALLAGDAPMPANHVERSRALVLADRAALRQVD